jgi:hypothetical protein
LSNTNSTLERLAGFRDVVPLKMTSCMDSPRNSEALLSPNTQRTASMMLDFPHPLGPTTPTNCPGSMKLVGSAKDLKPDSLIELRRTADPYLNTKVFNVGRTKLVRRVLGQVELYL